MNPTILAAARAAIDDHIESCKRHLKSGSPAIRDTLQQAVVASYVNGIVAQQGFAVAALQPLANETFPPETTVAELQHILRLFLLNSGQYVEALDVALRERCELARDMPR